MPLRVAVPKETAPGERRVALIPPVVERLTKLGVEVVVERGAGLGTYYHDADYDAARMEADHQAVYQADVVLRVQPPSLEDIALMQRGTVLIGFFFPHRHPEVVRALRDAGITSFAMEAIPRISRAQSMDALSSQASVSGYKCALLAAERTGRFFPMLTTAAGTIRPARVLVVGAGVAGLQAIATCKRLGAIVDAYDIRKAAKEQVESLGAKIVETGVDAESEGGYARELTEEEKQRQQEALASYVAAADAVITTASVPGKRAPVIITKDMVEAMKTGSVIIDLAAEGGGNCELTEPGQEIDLDGVTIYGPENIPSMLPLHASELYARNLFNFLSPHIQDGELKLNWDDDIIAGSCLTHDGAIRQDAARELIEGGQE